MDIVPCKTGPNQLVVEEESKKELNREEYPIIWFDTGIYSEEKKTLKSLIQQNSEIKLVSEFEDAFQTAQSLGSFLLITPSEVDEKKLFQDFQVLKDTYGRRYFDFEEEAVLRSLFKEISEEKRKSLKVYVFCTRDDFLKKTPVNEEEEEVVLKCDIKETAKQFPEEFTLIWCDSEYSPENMKTLVEKLDLQEENIKTTNFEDLLKKLEEKSELSYHVILSGKMKTETMNIETIIDKIDDFKDLLGVYIYDSSLKVKGRKAQKIKIEETLEELIPKIIEGFRTNSKHKNTFPAFATQFDDWDKSHINKVHYYLRGFVNFKNRRQAKGDFVNLAKRAYQSKMLLDFERKYDEYNREQILKWYVSPAPIYKLVNNCLRIATSDSITYSRFVLRDLERAIREDFQQQSKTYNGVVYRGAYISEDEFEKLKINIGKEIEMYGFLSTTTNQNVAENFMCDNIKGKVFITIIIPPIPSPELDEQGFVDLRKRSGFPEEEILFNVRSRFQVLEVGSTKLSKSEAACRYLVLLYRAQLLRQSMTDGNPKINLTFKLPLELKCSKCESKNNLFAYTEEPEKAQMICQECLIPNKFASKTTFLLPVDEKVELDKNRMTKIEVKGKKLKFDGEESRLTYAKTDKCHQCSKSGEDFYKWINYIDGNVKLYCFECFKNTQENKINHLLCLERGTEIFWGSQQGKWERIDKVWKTYDFDDVEALYGVRIFEKSHENEKCKEFCRRFLQNSSRKMGREEMKVDLYCSLGRSSERLGEHQIALEYVSKTLEIQKFFYGEKHLKTASSFHDLAAVHQSLAEYKKTLEYRLEALEIRKSIDGEESGLVADSLDQVGSVYHKLGQYKKALEYHEEALKIRISIYGRAHPETITSINNIATVYHSLGHYQKALECFERALENRKSLYGESHPETPVSYSNLASVYNSLGEYQKAYECYQKAHEIFGSMYVEAHPKIATSFHNLAIALQSLGRYQIARGYHEKALEIRQSIYGEEAAHPETAASYDHLATVLPSFGEYQKAEEYSLKALEIRKKVFGEEHPNTVASFNNLASVYHSLGNYQKALEYYQKAQKIFESIYGEAHPDTITGFSNLGLTYFSLGKHEEALEFYTKAKNLSESIYEKAHPAKALSYEGLATVYQKLGDNQKALESVDHRLKSYEKALEYYVKAIEILESLYENKHPGKVVCYNNIAAVYSKLGDNQNALTYFEKAAEMQELIHGETHPEMAIAYENLAEVWFSLKDFANAQEYLSKALDLRKLLGETHPKVAALYKKQIAIYIESENDGQDKKYLFMIPGVLEVLQIKSDPKSVTEEKADESFPSHGLQASIQVEKTPHFEKMEDSKTKNLLEKQRLISDLIKKIKASAEEALLAKMAMMAKMKEMMEQMSKKFQNNQP